VLASMTFGLSRSIEADEGQQRRGHGRQATVGLGRPPQDRHGEGQGPGGHDEIERDEEVGRLATGLDRHPEGQHGDGQDRQRGRAAAEADRGGGHEADAEQGGDEGGKRVRADRVELRRVPHLAQEQERREDERAQRGQGPRPGARREDGDGHDGRHHEPAEVLNAGG
jgi:hypothetical protein